MSERMEEFEKTHPVAGDIATNGEEIRDEEGDLDPLDEPFDDEDETWEEEAEQPPKRHARVFCRQALPVWLILARYLFPVVTGIVLLCLSFGELFEFYQSASVGTISIVGLYGATLETVFGAFSQITNNTVLWYAIIQLMGAIVGIVAFVLAWCFALLAAITACITFSKAPNHPTGNRMKVIFKIAFPNRVCLFLANAAYVIPFLFPYYFAFVLERFYYMGVNPELPIYVKSNPCFWVAVGMAVITLVLAVASPRFERRRRMNMFLVEHNEESEEEA